VSKVFVGNLALSATKQDLEGLFAVHGVILDVSLPVDRDSGRPRGFGFVTFDSAESATAAIQQLDGVELLGRNLRVNAAEAKRPDQPRRHFGDSRGGAPPPRTFSRPKGSRRGLRGRKRSL
jgi:RNA recognition motif-containing protein